MLCGGTLGQRTHRSLAFQLLSSKTKSLLWVLFPVSCQWHHFAEIMVGGNGQQLLAVPLGGSFLPQLWIFGSWAKYSYSNPVWFCVCLPSVFWLMWPMETILKHREHEVWLQTCSAWTSRGCNRLDGSHATFLVLSSDGMFCEDVNLFLHFSFPQSKQKSASKS